jgi:hypothetical protein
MGTETTPGPYNQEWLDRIAQAGDEAVGQVREGFRLSTQGTEWVDRIAKAGDEAITAMREPAPKVELPWKAGGLQGFNSSHGPTYDGGSFAGGGPSSPRALFVRVTTPMGRPASVHLDICDDSHGCTVWLDPATARQAAAALLAGADEADAEMAHWREVLDKQQARLFELHMRDVAGRAGQPAE